jgi:hypothetical protein
MNFAERPGNDVNAFIHGDPFIPGMEQQMKRYEETGGPRLPRKGGLTWPGLDTCKACPLFRADEI